MKTQNLLAALLLLLLTGCYSYAASKTPIKDGVLQTDLNGNGKSITNASYVGNGAGLTDVPLWTNHPGPIKVAGPVTITNTTGVLLRMDAQPGQSAEIAFNQGAATTPVFRFLMNDDADELMFFQGTKNPLSISEDIFIRTNVYISSGTLKADSSSFLGDTRVGGRLVVTNSLRANFYITAGASSMDVTTAYRTITNWTGLRMTRHASANLSTGVLTVTNVGYMSVHSDLCWDSNTGSGAFEAEIFTNGVATLIELHRDMPTGTSLHGAASMSGFVYSPGNMTIDVRMKTGAGTETVNVIDASLMVIQLPD